MVIYAFLSGLLFTSCNSDKKESISTGEITLDSAIALAKHVEYTVPGDSCISLYLNAMILAKKEGNFGRQIYLHDKLAENYNYFHQYKKGKKHLDSALQIAEVHNTHYEAIGMCYSSLGSYYRKIRDFEKALYYLEKTLDYRLKNLGKDHEDISNSYFVLGYYYLVTRREFDKSIEYNEKALELRIKSYGKESGEAAECYSNLAYAYSELGDNKKAIKFQKKAVEVMKKTFAQNGSGILNGYSLMGYYHSILGDNSTAIQWYQKILNSEKNKENQYIKISILNSLGDAYLNDDLKKAKSLYDSCLNILHSKYGLNHAVTISSHKKLSNYYQKANNYDSAIYHLNIACKLIIEYNGVNSISYANTAIDYAELLLKNRQSSKAIEKANEAINAISTFQYASGDKKGLISSSEELNRMDLATAFFLKAKGLSQINTISSLKSSFNYLLRSIEIIENIKRKYSSNESRSYLSNQTEIVFDNAIQVALKLVNLTGELYYKEYAFTIAEKSRAFNLLAEVKNSNAKKFSGIPPEISDKEEKLKRDITFYNELAYKYSKNKIVDTTGLKKIKSTLFEKERQYDVFIKNLEINYPKYHQIKNQAFESKVEGIQKLLSDDEAIIEYFLGEKNLVAFVLTGDSYEVSNIKIDSIFNPLMNKFQRSLTKRNYQEFLSNSTLLYQSLIEPIDGYLAGKFKKLRIIPHNELASLSFDCLVVQEENNLSSSETRFLIEEYEVRYHYSASYLKAKYADAPKNNKAIVFAPIFEENDQLNRLKWSEREANKISNSLINNQFITNLYLRGEATKTKFINNSLDKDIIHLATHSFLDQENIDQSKIYFSENGENDNSLTLAETYNLNINPNLLTLSSCETGVGKVMKGEGMLSFTRGFSYSGAKNIVCSMWKVDDLYTSELMINMYKNILEGETISHSLRDAKLKLLKEQRGIHPKEWAAFILIEN